MLQEFPFGVHLARHTEFFQLGIGVDAVEIDVLIFVSISALLIQQLLQQGNRADLLDECGIERNFVDPDQAVYGFGGKDNPEWRGDLLDFGPMAPGTRTAIFQWKGAGLTVHEGAALQAALL